MKTKKFILAVACIVAVGVCGTGYYFHVENQRKLAAQEAERQMRIRNSRNFMTDPRNFWNDPNDPVTRARIERGLRTF